MNFIKKIASFEPKMTNIIKNMCGVQNKRTTCFGTPSKTFKDSEKPSTSESQNLLPIIEDWEGHDTPGISMVGRLGKSFFFSPFGDFLLPGSIPKLYHNFNMHIAGNNRSILLTELMANILGVGGKVYAFDWGGKLKKTSQVIGGQHIEIDVKDSVCFNPFANLPEGDSYQDIAVRNEMFSLISIVIQGITDSKVGQDSLKNCIIERAIESSWKEYKTKSTLETVIECMLTRDDLVSKKLAQDLSLFLSKKNFNFIFNKNLNINFDNNFIVIDVDNLCSTEKLREFVIQMFIIEIYQTMFKGGSLKPFLIVIDDATKLLCGRKTWDFMCTVSIMARRLRGSIVLGSQNLTDFFIKESPSAEVSFNGSAWKCILDQDRDVVESYKNYDQLKIFVDNDYKETLLQSISSSPSKYAEIAIFGPNVYGAVGRLHI